MRAEGIAMLAWTIVSQEFLSCLFFILIKHPFDFGDRVNLPVSNVSPKREPFINKKKVNARGRLILIAFATYYSLKYGVHSFHSVQNS